MRFGIFSNGQRHQELAALSYEEDLWEIQEADRVGFHEAWVSEHAGIRKDVLPNSEPLITMAAACTEQIVLAPAVRVLPALHPVDVATQAAVCDHLTRGRYMLGIGAGSEFRIFCDQRGIDHEDRHERMLESLEIILTCWTEPGPVEYSGKFWHGSAAPINPKPFTKPHPAIGVASDQEAVIDLVAERGYRLLSAHFDGAAYLRAKGDRLEQIGSDGRQRYTVSRMVHVADTDAEAYENVAAEVNRDFEYQLSIAPGNILFFKRRNPEITRVDIEGLREAGLFMIGSPASVYDQLARFHDDTGGFGTLLTVMGKDWGTREARARSLHLFMDQVAPRLDALAPTARAAEVSSTH